MSQPILKDGGTPCQLINYEETKLWSPYFASRVTTALRVGLDYPSCFPFADQIFKNTWFSIEIIVLSALYLLDFVLQRLCRPRAYSNRCPRAPSLALEHDRAKSIPVFSCPKTAARKVLMHVQCFKTN